MNQKLMFFTFFLILSNMNSVIACPAHAGPKKNRQSTNQTKGRTFTLKLDQSVFVKKTKVTLSTPDRATKNLDYDTSKTSGDTIDIYLPENLTGRFRLSWTVESVNKETLSGFVDIEQES